MNVCEGCKNQDTCEFYQQQQADENGFCADYMDINGFDYVGFDIDVQDDRWLEMSWYRYTEGVLNTDLGEYELFNW